MRHQDDQSHIKPVMDNELAAIHFTEQLKQQVITRAAQKPSFWDRKITLTIPVTAVFSVCCILGLSITLYLTNQEEPPASQASSGERIVLESGVYSAKDLSRLIQSAD